MWKFLQNALLRLRIFLEGMTLWSGSLVLGLVLCHLLTSGRHLPNHAERLVNTVVMLLEAASAIWIVVARRKDLGERIRTWEYVLLSFLSFGLTGWYALAWFVSLGN